jgi:hypothetical protein
MNERIKELAEQAGYLPDMFNRGHWDLPECHKFYELIVRECIDILDARRKIHTSPTYRSIDSQDRVDAKAEELLYSVMDIKQHFGVE